MGEASVDAEESGRLVERLRFLKLRLSRADYMTDMRLGRIGGFWYSPMTKELEELEEMGMLKIVRFQDKSLANVRFDDAYITEAGEIFLKLMSL